MLLKSMLETKYTWTSDGCNSRHRIDNDEKAATFNKWGLKSNPVLQLKEQERPFKNYIWFEFFNEVTYYLQNFKFQKIYRIFFYQHKIIMLVGFHFSWLFYMKMIKKVIIR